MPSRRHPWSTPALWVGLPGAVLLAAAAAGIPAPAHAAVPAAGWAVLVAPGWAALRLVRRRAAPDHLTCLAESFAASLVILLPVTGLSLLLHVSARVTGPAVVIASLVALAIGARRPPRPMPRDRGPIAAIAPVVMLLGLVCAVAMTIAALEPVTISPAMGHSDEQRLHMVTMRRFLDARPVSFWSLLWRENMPSVYMVPVWHHAVAAVTAVSQAELAVAYALLRGLNTWLSVASFAALAGALLSSRGDRVGTRGRREARWAALAVGGMLFGLLLSGRLEYAFSYHAAVAPFTHPGAVGACILAPLLLYVGVRAVRTPGVLPMAALTAITAASLGIQARQAAQLVLFLGLWFLAEMMLRPRSRAAGGPTRPPWRIGVALICVYTVTWVYAQVNSRLVWHVVELEELRMNIMWHRLDTVLGWGFPQMLRMRPQFVSRGFDLWMCLPVTLVWLLPWLRRHPAARAAWAWGAGMILILAFPLLRYLVICLTYSEFLASELRFHMITGAVIAAIGVLWAQGRLEDRLPRTTARSARGLAVTALLGAVAACLLVPVADHLQHLLQRRWLSASRILVGAVLLSVPAALLWQWLRRSRPVAGLPRPSPTGAALALGIGMGAAGLGHVLPSPDPDSMSPLRRAAAAAPVGEQVRVPGTVFDDALVRTLRELPGTRVVTTGSRRDALQPAERTRHHALTSAMNYAPESAFVRDVWRTWAPPGAPPPGQPFRDPEGFFEALSLLPQHRADTADADDWRALAEQLGAEVYVAGPDDALPAEGSGWRLHRRLPRTGASVWIHESVPLDE